MRLLGGKVRFRFAIAVLCVALAGTSLAGCDSPGGPQATAVAGPAQGVAGARTGPPRADSSTVPTPMVQGTLTNKDWASVSQNPDLYKGSQVEITGEVFNILGHSDGYLRFQIYTDPQSMEGNTHVAIQNMPRLLKNGYQVRVTGVLQGTIVSRSVSGRVLRLPEVEAQSVEIVGPPEVVTPTTTSLPTATQTETAVPSATATATEVPPTATVAPATSTPSMIAATPTGTVAPSPEATAAATAIPSPEATAPAATPAPSPAATPESLPAAAQGAMPLVVSVSTATVSAPMTVGQDPAAMDGQYLYTTSSDQNWEGSGDPPATGMATLQVDVPKDGDYAIWVHMWYASGSGNSVWMAVDGQTPIKVGNEDSGYRSWKWVGWHDGDAQQRISVQMTAGSHTLQLIGREAGARVDEILVTDDMSYTPQ